MTTQIETGRELDALVAVKVMGWSVLRVDEQETWWLKGSPDHPTESAYEPPHYSTTGDGMLAVLERMRALGWEWDISEVSSGPVGAEHTQYARAWSASLEAFSDDDGRFFISHADTLPHAVCLAALEAVRA